MATSQKIYHCQSNKDDRIRVSTEDSGEIWIGYFNSTGYLGEVFLTKEDSQRLLKQLLDIENKGGDPYGTII